MDFLRPDLLPYQRSYGPDSVVLSHVSATWLHKVGNFHRGLPQLTVSTARRSSRSVSFYTATLDPRDITSVQGLPVTTPERTIADLIRARHDTSHVAGTLAEFGARGVLDLGALIRNLEPLARRNGHQSGEAFTADLEIMAGLDIKSVQVKALAQLTSALMQERIAARSGQFPLPGYTNTMPSPERIVP